LGELNSPAMKYNLTPCLALLLVLTASNHVLGQSDLQQRIKTFRNSKRFTVKYDRFKDETRVSVGPFYPDHKAEIEARFSFKGQQPAEPVQDAYFIIREYGRDFRFVDNRTLYGIIDGERIEFGEGQRSSHVEPRTVSETLVFTVPMKVFRKLAGAKSAEFKVASVEFSLNGEHLEALRDLASMAHQ
jgi:hypothetical protein